MNGEHVVAIGERLHRVGTVRFGGLRQKQVSSFRYADDWIGNPAAFALAPSLPLSDQWFHFASLPDDAGGRGIRTEGAQHRHWPERHLQTAAATVPARPP